MTQRNYAQAINDAYQEAMTQDPKVIAYGLGIDDPKGIFGTTLGLQETFGVDRVFDMPTSENAMTGIGIGASLNGVRPVMCHQRLDFFLLAMDQLVNNAAKWRYMFGGQNSVPITIRLIIGRGWGQGPTHSQSLQSWFAHVPGLKVVMPALPSDAKGLLLSCIFDDNPTLYLEHRWLHNLQGDVPEGDFRVPIGKARTLSEGDDLTIVSHSYMTIEALRALETFKAQGVEVDLVDLRSIAPLDWEAVFESVEKTGRLLVLDTSVETASISAEIIARVCMECASALKVPPKRIALPDCPTPTSVALTKHFYKGAEDILQVGFQMLGHAYTPTDKQEQMHDIPGQWFKGPF